MQITAKSGMHLMHQPSALSLYSLLYKNEKEIPIFIKNKLKENLWLSHLLENIGSI